MIAKRPIASEYPVFCVVMIALCVALAGGAVSAPDDTPVERGKIFAQENCARCHSIEMEGASPYPSAPPFRILHERYDVGDLAEALAEGIVVVHSGGGEQMPEYVLEPDQIDDLIAFLRSLKPEGSARAALR